LRRKLGARGLGFRGALLHAGLLRLIERLLVVEILGILSLDNGGTGLREVLVREVSVRSHIAKKFGIATTAAFDRLDVLER
jgi:hypothetical protein